MGDGSCGTATTWRTWIYRDDSAARECDAAAALLVDDVSRERASEEAVFVLEVGEPVGVVEKPVEPPSTLVPRGVFVFSERIFAAVERMESSARGEYELADAIDVLFDEGSGVELVEMERWVKNINTAVDMEEASRWLCDSA